MNVKDCLLIHKSILPDYFEHVLKAKEYIEKDNVQISEACRIVGISRGTYYKYKDYISVPTYSSGKRAIVSLKLSHDKGVLSGILDSLAHMSGSVLAINQEFPINNAAFVMLTIDITDINISVEEIVKILKEKKGVLRIDLLSVE